jgi:hypothetical protein
LKTERKSERHSKVYREGSEVRVRMRRDRKVVVVVDEPEEVAENEPHIENEPCNERDCP